MNYIKKLTILFAIIIASSATARAGSQQPTVDTTSQGISAPSDLIVEASNHKFRTFNKPFNRSFGRSSPGAKHRLRHSHSSSKTKLGSFLKFKPSFKSH